MMSVVDGDPDVVLICGGDDSQLIRRLAQGLEAAGHRPWWDEPSMERSLKQRDRLLREAVAAASACAVVLTQAGPNTRQLRKAEVALQRLPSFRLIAVLLPGGPSPSDLPEWLIRHGQCVDLRNAPSEQDAMRALAGVLRGDAPPAEFALPAAEPSRSGGATSGSITASSRRSRPSKAPTEEDDAERPEFEAPSLDPIRLFTRLVAPRLGPRDDVRTKSELRAAMATTNPEMAKHYLDEARARYDDIHKRAENVERRAATLQASVVLAVTFTLTGGALLLDATKVPSTAWRQVMAVAVLVVVGLFVYSGLHASLAIGQSHPWKIVGRYSLQDAALGDDLAKARLHRAAAYLWCSTYNARVNRWKVIELARARRWFIGGLMGLVVVATLVAAYAFVRPK
jgi:hypothetical protein